MNVPADPVRMVESVMIRSMVISAGVHQVSVLTTADMQIIMCRLQHT